MKIAVLFGSDSMERDVSVASARQVVTALRSRGHEVVAVDGERGPLSASDEAATFAKDIAKEPPRAARSFGLPGVVARLAGAGFDLVFLAVHGGKGEDGTLQSLLDAHGIRYTGSDRLGCSLAWDKSIAKQLFRVAQIPTPPWRIAPVDSRAIVGASLAGIVGASLAGVERDLGYPLIVKPSGQGSTVGLSLVREPGELDAAIAHAAQYDACVLLEAFIEGRELTVGVLGDKVLAVGEIIPRDGGIFDYEAKYQADAAEEIFPADVPAEIAGQAQTLALVAHDALRLKAYSRADFRLDANGGLWCLEVNTLPGLSRGSLMPQSAAAAGIEFADLCERICQAALA